MRRAKPVAGSSSHARTVSTGRRSTQLPSLPDAIRVRCQAAYLEGDRIWLELELEALLGSLAERAP